MDLENLTNKEIQKRDKTGRKLGWAITRNVLLSGLSVFGLTSCDQCDPVPLPEPVSITRIAKYNAPSDYTELVGGNTFTNLENTDYTLRIEAEANELNINFGSKKVMDNTADDLNSDIGKIRTDYTASAPAADITEDIDIQAISKSGTDFDEKTVSVQGIDGISPIISGYTFNGSAVTDLEVELTGNYALDVTHDGDSLDVMIEKYSAGSFHVFSNWTASTGQIALGEGRFRVDIRSSNASGSDIERFDVVGADFSTSGLAPGDYQHHHVTPEEFDLAWTDLEADGLDMTVKTRYDGLDDLTIETGTGVTVPIDDKGAYSAMMFVKSPTSGLWIPSGQKMLGFEGLNLDPYTVDGNGNINGFAGSNYTRQLTINEVSGEKDPNADNVIFKCQQTLPSYMSLDQNTGLITITNPPAGDVSFSFYSADPHDNGLIGPDPNNGNTQENAYTVNFVFVE